MESAEAIKNPACKKVRGAHVLEVSCARCRAFVARYQKVGKSNFVKMYTERIIDGAVDYSEPRGAVFCVRCGALIATRYTVKADKKEAFRLAPSAFRKRRVLPNAID